jgi:hypothetical protein
LPSWETVGAKFCSNKMTAVAPIQNFDQISDESSKVKQQQLQLQKKTISRQFLKMVQILRKNRNPKEFTCQNVANFVFKAVFWIPIYIIFGYLTISTSIPLIQEYKENPTYQSMTAAINQQTVAFPNFTLCFYFNVTMYFDDIDSRNREDSESTLSSTNILEKFFNESTQNGTFEATHWPSTINGVLVRYLILIYELEWFQNSTEKSSFDWLYGNETDDEHWMALKNIFAPKIAQYNITTFQLKAAFQKAYTILYVIDTNEKLVPWTNLISFIGRESFCIRFTDFVYPVPQYFIYPGSLQFVISMLGNLSFVWPYSLDFTDSRSTPPPKGQFVFLGDSSCH